MIWDLLEVVTNPKDYAIKIINGEIHVRPKFNVNQSQPQETTMSDSMSSLINQILDIAEEYPRDKAHLVLAELIKETLGEKVQGEVDS